MYERRLTLGQCLVRWSERRLALEAIERALKPLLLLPKAFQPQPMLPKLGTWCKQAIGPLFPFDRIEILGNDSTLPPRPFETVGYRIERSVNYAARIGYQREWIPDILVELLSRYLRCSYLPETQYDRDSTFDVLYHLGASILAGSADPYLYAIAELAAMGNEPLYLGSELDEFVLYFRCDRSQIPKS